MPNPFGITQVDIPGVFGAVQQAKSSALNFEIAQEELNAFRQNRESQKQLADVRRRAIGGDEGAVEQLAAIDPGEATDLVKFFSETDKLGRERAEDAALEMARFGTEFLEAAPEDRPAIVKKAKDKFPDLADKIPDNPTDAQARAFITNAQSAATLMSVINPDKKTPNTIAIGHLDNEGKLVTEEIIDMNNHPDPIGFLNKAAQDGKAIFDPEQASAGQGVGQSASRVDAFRVQKENAANLIKDINAIEERLARGGAKITGFTGNLAELVSDIQIQLQATGELIGFAEFSEDFDQFLGLADPEDAATIRSAGAQNAALEADIKALAYMTAIARFGQEGRGLSDNDFKIALKIVAGSSQDPAKMLLVMEGNKEAIIRRLETTAQGSEGLLQFKKDEFNRQFGLTSSEGDVPLIATQEEYDALPSGTRYKQADGREFIKP